MPKIFAPLDADEAKALVKLSLRERRDPRQQAAFLIRQQLERLGLLPSTPAAPKSEVSRERV